MKQKLTEIKFAYKKRNHNDQRNTHDMFDINKCI